MNTMSLSNHGINTQRAVAQPNGALVRDSLLAGSAGGAVAILAGALQVVFSGSLAELGLAAGPVFAGLLIALVAAALLGGLFGFVTRRVCGLPSDYGVPALSGLVFGLLIWLAVYLVAPISIVPFLVYGTVTGLALAKLRPEPYICQ